ncbi:MAG: thioredoxin-disulfide reductase [Candidatus Levyibacteriota bacterium]
MNSELPIFDVIIIGSGPSGLTAGIYTSRAGLKTLIIAGKTWGGQLMLTTEVENFPGFPKGIQGPQLMMEMRSQAERFGVTFVNADADPTDLTGASSPFSITADGKTYKGKALLLATGENSKTLGVPGEKELTGRGISYCATCDGAFFRGKKIIVVGGGDSAMEEANFLTNFAEVTLLHRRDSFRASQIMQDKVKNNPKIKVMLNSQIVEVLGGNKVEKVKIQNTVSQEVTEMPIDGIFVAIGHTPNSSIFKGVDLTQSGYVSAKERVRTNIEGVFVSGDVQDDRYRQAVTAAGFGCMAALDIERWLTMQKA